ncbi:MAG: tRNA (adenosine(37)-N6)-threonylcarbamoyltransferase complex dimerization subunit type 1 TsaB [Flavobacteriaceae bacterium]|nr:MAG: tRNA (adenosine(37)-N6)-threonylcarbamoyltransferase complex dimerization subunit type 1 TsaB [Flavobacteriaceae bacterium]
MAIILNLETTTQNCSVSICQDGKTISLVEELSEEYSHDQNLHRFVKWALEGANLSLKDLNAIAVSKGPGSYTGLRIGTSAAKGYCLGLGIPLLGIETLMALSISQELEKLEPTEIISVLDARRMEVYTQTFSVNTGERSEVLAKIIDETSFSEFSNKPVMIGVGTEKCKNIMANKQFVYLEKYPSAEQMSKLSYEKFIQSDFEDLAYFEPFYLKEFQTQTKKDKT